MRGAGFPFRSKTKKDVLFIIGDWNAKVGSEETPGVTGKFGLGIRNEAGQRLIEFGIQCASKFEKFSSGHRTGKGQLSFQAMPKNAQITTQVHSSHMLEK